MSNIEKQNDKLDSWKKIVQVDENAYADEIGSMESREKIYRGQNSIDEIIKGDEVTTTPHVRNIVAEIIESQINSDIPQPKVTALKKEDELLARLVEDMIRNKLNKLPVEAINDQMERTVPVQGGGFLLYEWDNEKRTHTTVGEGVLSYRHTKQVIPQSGITSDIEDMDHITVKMPKTAAYIMRKYGVDVKDAGEEDPSLRSPDGSESSVSDMVTQYVVYYRNDDGGIGKFSWVHDKVLEDYEDYQARLTRKCERCGAPEPTEPVDEITPTLDGTFPIDEKNPNPEEIKRSRPPFDKCPNCGGVFVSSPDEFTTTTAPIYVAGNEAPIVEANAQIPNYKPDIYPVFLQRNVSTFGRFLGESDVDKIKTQQNTTNRLEAKILQQLLGGGSYITLPDDVTIKKNTLEGKEIRLSDPSKKAMIDVYDMTVNIEPALAMLAQVYTEAQQEIGITSSYLGREDSTATSGKAKEISAAQAAGRLESKRVMKNEAYSRLFEAMFKFELAYADEERPVAGKDEKGNHKDEVWNKWLFLKQDDAGAYYWNDAFLFSCDDTAPLANNRQAMWKEVRSHFESGAFGDKANIETQIIYWGMMAELHYPGAEKTKTMLEDVQKKQAASQLRLAQAQKQAVEYSQNASGQNMDGGEVPAVMHNPQPQGALMNAGGEPI